jgi:uncharacterized membrane protein YqjE
MFRDSFNLPASSKGRHARCAAAALIASVVLAVFGYVLILLFILSVGIVFGVSWLWISLGLALLHFAGLAICAFLAIKSLRSPFFKATAAELKRDFDALKTFGS